VASHQRIERYGLAPSPNTGNRDALVAVCLTNQDGCDAAEVRHIDLDYVGGDTGGHACVYRIAPRLKNTHRHRADQRVSCHNGEFLTDQLGS
jgi:hypothetical protein